MEFIDHHTIKLDKILNRLDKFVLGFVEVLEKFTKYVLVSGYVSILFGRSRMSEDIDIMVPKLQKARLKRLVNALEAGFVCIRRA